MATKAAKPKAATKSVGGRPTKRTPETEAKLLFALRKGNTRRAACAYAGIGESTLNDWVNEFPEFSAACTRAENESEFGYIDVIQECANNGDWKAAAWWLERRRKAEYSAKQEVDHTSSDGSMTPPQAFTFVPYVSTDTDSA